MSDMLIDIVSAEGDRLVKEVMLSNEDLISRYKIGLKDYCRLIRYCSYKLMGDSDILAYRRAEPLSSLKMGDDEVRVEVSRIVRGIGYRVVMERAYIPVWILNAEVYQQAVNVQVELMRNGRSEAVRQKAADSLMCHLRRPEVSGGVNVEVNVGGINMIEELKVRVGELVDMQRESVKIGDGTYLDVLNGIGGDSKVSGS